MASADKACRIEERLGGNKLLPTLFGRRGAMVEIPKETSNNAMESSKASFLLFAKCWKKKVIVSLHNNQIFSKMGVERLVVKAC